MKMHATVFSRQSVDARRYDGNRNRLSRANADFPRCRVGKKVDVLNALSQVIEDCDTAFLEGKAEGGRYDSAPSAIDEPDAKRTLQFCNRLGYGWLGYVEMASRLSHAAGINEGH